MSDSNLLPAFHFSVKFNELPGNTDSDSRFMSVSGLKAVVTTPDFTNIADKKSVPHFGPLILKRAVSANTPSPLRDWVLKSMSLPGTTILPEVLIEVLGETHQPQLVFKAKQVSAIGWELGELHAAKSELLMEEIILQYISLELV